MPYKSESIKIEHTKHDKRHKLTDGQKDKIISLRGVVSCHRVALEFGISRRTVQFLWYPERIERNKQLRKERGGSRIYYTKEKNAEYHKIHRHYKQELYLAGEIA